MLKTADPLSPEQQGAQQKRFDSYSHSQSLFISNRYHIECLLTFSIHSHQKISISDLVSTLTPLTQRKEGSHWFDHWLRELAMRRKGINWAHIRVLMRFGGWKRAGGSFILFHSTKPHLRAECVSTYYICHRMQVIAVDDERSKSLTAGNRWTDEPRTVVHMLHYILTLTDFQSHDRSSALLKDGLVVL